MHHSFRVVPGSSQIEENWCESHFLLRLAWTCHHERCCTACCLSSGSQPPSLCALKTPLGRAGWVYFRTGQRLRFTTYDLLLVGLPADSAAEWRVSPQGGNSINLFSTNRHSALLHVKDGGVIPQRTAGRWQEIEMEKRPNAAFGCFFFFFNCTSKVQLG